MNTRLLIVDDQASMGKWLVDDLSSHGYEATSTTDPKSILSRLPELDYDVVITDLKMPGTSGLDLCREITSRRPDVPVIVMTAFGSLESAIEAIRAGAYDFVTKPIEIDLLDIVIKRAARHRELQNQLAALEEQVRQQTRSGELVGESPAMLELLDQIQRAAPSEASILIHGESGTGKELVANAIHLTSDRRDRPFVAVNCAALPEALIESELFGHSKGAFTDAKLERRGLFAQADQGTLFLDEIGDLPLPLQAKLLRALEQRSIRPVGSDKEQPIDVRVLSATHQDIEQAVEDGRFRQDLYYRLNVIELEVPPLRARGNDVLLLAQQFLQEFAGKSSKAITGLSEPAAGKLLAYDWPGNVRELRNVMERAVAMARFDHLGIDDLPDKIKAHEPNRLVFDQDDPAQLVPLAEIERRYIDHVLHAVGNNRSTAARILGLDRKTLYRRLKTDAEASKSEDAS